jgi:hypothetical protein
MDDEAGELTNVTLNLYRTPVILDDAVGHRQPQPGTVANIFGCKKWIEHAINVFWWDTGTIIFKGHGQAMDFVVRRTIINGYAGLSHSRGDPDRSTGLQRIERIEKEIDKHLL